MSKKRSKIEQFLVDKDMYGHVLNVNYRGSDTYQTLLGSFCTFGTYVIMLINISTLLLAFKLGSRQYKTFHSVWKDRWTTEPFILDQYNLNVAIFESNPIPSCIASV